VRQVHALQHRRLIQRITDVKCKSVLANLSEIKPVCYSVQFSN
jgi:hypothetical protein